jgi:hypothetical protein
MSSEFITDTVLEWFQGLDYEYMVLHIIVCYGLYYSDNLRWIVEYFSPVRRKGISKAVWLVGGVLAVIEMARFFPFVGDGGLDHQKFISILHSYVVVQVFVEPIVSTVNNWLKVFKKTANNITSGGGS